MVRFGAKKVETSPPFLFVNTLLNKDVLPAKDTIVYTKFQSSLPTIIKKLFQSLLNPESCVLTELCELQQRSFETF